MDLTQLSARQIRYYEEHNLVSPTRTKGNRRLFSFNDVDKLLEIKDLLDQGLNMAGIKQVLLMKENQTEAVKVKEETKEISKLSFAKYFEMNYNIQVDSIELHCDKVTFQDFSLKITDSEGD